jgi:uncharacterized membrane protein HdeD (DUF308 family)
MTDIGRSEAGGRFASSSGPGWGWMIGYGVISIIFGALALIWPFPATLAATLLIGVAFVVSGIVALIAGIRGTGAESRGYTIILGLISIVAGVITVGWPLTGAISLTLVLAAWLLVRGITEIAYAFRMRRRRWMMLLYGVVNILLALMVVATVPLSALTIPGFILGMSFLFGGVVAIMAGVDQKSGTTAFRF